MVSSKSERFREVSKKSPRGFREVSERFREVSKTWYLPMVSSKYSPIHRDEV